MLRVKKSPSGFAFAVVALVLLSPAETYANVISIFNQTLLLHLFVGNAVIGVIEGALIARFFKLRAGTTILLMIAANYFSTWTGAVGLSWLGSRFETPLARLVTLDTLQLFICGLILAAFVGSVVLEWPFCLIAMWRKPGRVSRSFCACALAQVVSYALVLLLNPPFGHFSGSPGTDPRVSVAPVASFADAPNVCVYFISAEDGDLYRVRPDGSLLTRVAGLPVRQPDTKLFAKPTNDPARWSLCLEKQYGWDEYPTGAYADTGVTVRGFTPSERDRNPYEDGWRRGKRAADFRPQDQRQANVFTASLGDTWLGVEPLDMRGADNRIHLQFDRLILHWDTRNATVLPSGQIVYQLGSQIVLFDANQRKIGLIALGRGPVVFVDEPPASRSAPASGPVASAPAGLSASRPRELVRKLGIVLSYSFTPARQGSNLRPSHPKCDVLPAAPRASHTDGGGVEPHACRPPLCRTDHETLGIISPSQRAKSA